MSKAEHPDWEITALDNFYRGTLRQIGDVTVQHVDIRDRSRLETALADADLVIHLAALTGVDECSEQPDLAYEVNVQGTNNVAWYCRQAETGLVFPFSGAVLGDPETFPITVELPRQPMNWYGRTKLLDERVIETLAEDGFPAYCLMKTNVYGEHLVDGTRVSKATVINFFIDRAFSDDPITVYEPGTQARNYAHVKDVATAYLRSAERLLDQVAAGDTGTWKYEIASDEDPSVMAIAELVQEIAAEEAGIETEVTLVENPRDNGTLVEEFTVDTTKAREQLGWEPTHTVVESIRELVRARIE